MNNFHIVVKKIESDLIPDLVDGSKFPGEVFMVREFAPGEGANGEHWHMYYRTEWNEKKLRREIDKYRPEKRKGLSVRSWDDNLKYFCKGLSIGVMPDVIKNTVGISDAEIMEMNQFWWDFHYSNPDLDPDSKVKNYNLLNMLVEDCRDQDLSYIEVMDKLIKILIELNGKKMTPNKFLAQSYVRTAMLFTKNKEYYTDRLRNFYLDGIYSADDIETINLNNKFKRKILKINL